MNKAYVIAPFLALLIFGGFYWNFSKGYAEREAVKVAAQRKVKEDKLKADNTNIVWTIMQVVLGALGAISVLMIVIGGLRFVLSQGDASAVSSAKNTVLYAVIGLVVALMAGGIVLLVTEYFG